MKNEPIKRSSSPQSSLMVEDETAERAKKLLRDVGLIVNAGRGFAPKPVAKKGAEKK